YEALDLFKLAVDRDWEPEPHQLQWVADRLIGVRTDQEHSLIIGSSSQHLAELGAVLQEKHPGCWDELVIPDTQGVHRPVRKALLDYLLNDPITDVRDYHPGSQVRPSLKHFYRWLGQDRELAG